VWEQIAIQQRRRVCSVRPWEYEMLRLAQLGDGADAIATLRSVTVREARV
jgi:hypothetical protein